MSPADSQAPAKKPDEPIQLIDLAAQRRYLGDRLDKAVSRVMDHGKYILGPEVQSFERQLAEYAGARHAIGVSNGTDALAIVLMAWQLRTGDAVMVPDFTFAATAEVVAWLGATPVFCDVDPETYNLDPQSLEAGIAKAREAGLTPKAVIAVDLFGLPADYDAIEDICARNGLSLLADAAQSFGATYNGRTVGSIGDAAATSFFPAKPLGCYGDGGAVFTDDDELAALIRSLRVHGQGSNKYDNVHIGMNGRLDAMQAAILMEKLAVFPDELVWRDRVAQRYADNLPGSVSVPAVPEGRTSAWAQYTIRARDRQQLAADLKEQGIPTAVYYPLPLSRQTAYQRYPTVEGGTRTAQALSQEVLSLPMHPYLSADVQDYVIDQVRRLTR